ncbi:hypothetical protein FOL47_010671 [Perkinsus chesapeaki]|uniref:Uncharacterized protein n=1 Tax=Perkinsus chesapeaki TaxID=330153 RepID=A0A7J6L2Z5_PERCH|nr:hypothetical protein FOL47_010671 [Perkinsus chesapeaki]
MVMFRDESLPFAKREDTMSLDTIKPKDVPRGRILYVKDIDASLTTSDIDKCKPCYYWLDYLHKPEFSLTFKTNRVLDPLNPIYKLPSWEAVPVGAPRFNGRVTNDIRDIEHSNPKRLIPDRNYVRDPNDVSDIEYARSKSVQDQLNDLRKRGALRDPRSVDLSLYAKDINAGPLDGRLPAMRGTDPLEPTYVIPTEPVLGRRRLPPATSLNHIWAEEVGKVEEPKMEPTTIGEVPLSRPRKLQWDNSEPFFSLLKEDIAGASSQRHVGCIPFNIYQQSSEDRPDLHNTADIPGAQVNSLKKGIVTRRKLDPQNPKYTFLDGSKGVVPRRVSVNSYGILGHEAARPATEVLAEAERGFPSTVKKVQHGGNVQVPELTVPSMRKLPTSMVKECRPTNAKSPAPSIAGNVSTSRLSIVTASTPGMTPVQRLDQFITPRPTARSSPPPV